VVVSSLASYAAFLAVGSYALTPLLVASLALQSYSLLRASWGAGCIEVIAIAYPAGLALSVVTALVRARILARGATEIGVVGGVRVYLCSSRTAASTFFPMSSIFVSRALAYVLSDRELKAVILHEYGHRSSPYRFANLAIAVLATLCIAASIALAIAGPSIEFALSAVMPIYSSLVALKCSSWIFEHVADEAAARAGLGVELCTSLIKVYACSRLGKLCSPEVLEAVASPRSVATLAQGFSPLKTLILLALPTPWLHPPLEARVWRVTTRLTRYYLYSPA